MRHVMFPDWESNAEELKKMYPKIYPCEKCKQYTACCYYNQCGKWQSFFSVAWKDACEIAKKSLGYKKGK